MSANATDWQAFFDEVAPRLLLYTRQWVADTSDAEDVVQMALIRFWRKFPGGSRKHLPLLYASARTIAIDLHRSNRRRSSRESSADPSLPREDGAYFDTDVETREMAQIVQAAIGGLPEEQREVVVLHTWAGLTFSEIARIVGRPTSTVAARHRYAIETLARRLAPFHADLSAIPHKNQTARTPT